MKYRKNYRMLCDEIGITQSRRKTFVIVEMIYVAITMIVIAAAQIITDGNADIYWQVEFLYGLSIAIAYIVIIITVVAKNMKGSPDGGVEVFELLNMYPIEMRNASKSIIFTICKIGVGHVAISEILEFILLGYSKETMIKIALANGVMIIFISMVAWILLRKVRQGKKGRCGNLSSIGFVSIVFCAAPIVASIVINHLL